MVITEKQEQVTPKNNTSVIFIQIIKATGNDE